MITNIDELKSEILMRGIAREEDLIGCEDRELESIEQQYGTLPLAYKQIMQLLGGRDRKWLPISGYEDFDIIFADFTAEIYESFQKYPDEIPPSSREIIGYMVDGDWLTSYQHLSGVENALDRIDYRSRARMGDRIKLVDAMTILERESINIEQDFHSFFPELQQHIQGWEISR